MNIQEKKDMTLGWKRYVRAVVSAGTTPAKAIGDYRGFTMVELLVVSAIIGVLVLIALASYPNAITSIRVARCSEEMRGLEKDIIAFAVDTGRYPNDLAEIRRDTMRDPWGNPYKYQNLSLAGDPPRKDPLGFNLNANFDLYSRGKDGGSVAQIKDVNPTTWDDIVLAGDGGFVGKADFYWPGLH